MRLGPKPRSHNTRARPLAPAAPETYATMRRPGCSAARQHLRRSAHGADELDLVLRPAEARAGDGEGRDVGIDQHAVRPEAPRKRGADAVQHRISARKHAGARGHAVARAPPRAGRSATARRAARQWSEATGRAAAASPRSPRRRARRRARPRPARPSRRLRSPRRRAAARSRHLRRLDDGCAREPLGAAGERSPVHVQEARLQRARRRSPPRARCHAPQAATQSHRHLGSDPAWRGLTPGGGRFDAARPARSGTRVRAPARRPRARAWR